MFKKILSKIKWWLEKSELKGSAFGTHIRQVYRTLKGLKIKNKSINL